MDPVTGIAAGGQILGSVYNMYQGYMQRRKGQQLLDSLRRPTYNTPQEALNSTNLAKNQVMNSRLAGQAEAENKLAGSTSQAIDLARASGRSPAEIMAIISGANTSQNEGLTNLAVAGDQRQQQDLVNYQNALNLAADYKDKEWAYNKWMPYQQDRQYAESLIGAGASNMNNSFNDITSGVASLGTSGVGSGDGLSQMLNAMRTKNTASNYNFYRSNPSGSMATGGSGYGPNYGLKLIK